MNPIKELSDQTSKIVKPLSQITSRLENEEGHRVDFEIILWPATKSLPSFLAIDAIRHPSDCIVSSQWTRAEAGHLRKMLGLVLDCS